jgi:hypothetical protein
LFSTFLEDNNRDAARKRLHEIVEEYPGHQGGRGGQGTVGQAEPLKRTESEARGEPVA